MARKEKIRPPGFDGRKHFRQKSMRVLIHVFTWIGVAVLYYIAFSFFFDTPTEYNMKNSTAELRKQYESLNERYDSVESVLKNVIDRDRNVFRLLFEAEPYELEEDYEAAKWEVYENMLDKSERELGRILSEKTKALEKKATRLLKVYEDLDRHITEKRDRIDYIPSIQPVNNPDLTLLTASFGMRIHPFYKTLSSHQGVDYTVPVGTRVFATADGKVKDVIQRHTSSGMTVIISHGNGYETQYSHLGRINVSKGETVRRGDIIALSGNSGLSLAPHLHYEIRHNNMRVDPIHYFFLELSPEQYKKIQQIAKSGMQSFD